jgi:hypothetical protein
MSGPSRAWVECSEAALRGRVALRLGSWGDPPPIAGKWATDRSSLSIGGLLWLGSELAASLF